MPINYQTVQRPLREKEDPYTFRANLFLGGACQPLIPFHLRSPRALNIAIDNPREIGILRRKHARSTLRTFAMGRRKTTYQHYRGSPPEIEEAGFQGSNCGMHDGFNARLRNGMVAAEELIAAPDFQAFLDSLVSEALIRCEGRVDLVLLACYGSLAGSGCAGGVLPITRAITSRLAFFDVETQVRFEFLGATTFAGVAVRGLQNYASSLVSVMRYATDSRSPLQDQITKQISLCEGFPFIDNAAARDRFILNRANAIENQQMQAHLALTEGNHRSRGLTMGTVNSQIDSRHGLDREDQIASVVAESLRDELRELLLDTQADPAQIDDMKWDVASTPQSRDDLDALLRRMEVDGAEQLIAAASAPASQDRVRLLIATAAGSELDAERLRDFYAVSPKDVQTFRERLRLLRTVNARLQSELQDVQTDLGQAQADREAFAADIQDWSVRQGGLRAGRAARRLAAAVTALRDVSDRWHRQRAEEAAVQRALSVVRHELGHHEGLLRQIERTLQEFVPRGSLRAKQPFVSTPFLQNVFPMLLELPALSREEQVTELCAAAGTVLPEGVAAIVGAASDRLDQIADRIVFGDYDVVGPPHAGRASQHISDVAYVVPPMEPQNESKLRKEILALDSSSTVVFYDSLAFGATVMRVQTRRFSDVQDVCDGILGGALAEAMQGPHAPLNTVDDFESVRHFGGALENGRVTFPTAASGQGRSH